MTHLRSFAVLSLLGHTSYASTLYQNIEDGIKLGAGILEFAGSYIKNQDIRITRLHLEDCS